MAVVPRLIAHRRAQDDIVFDQQNTHGIPARNSPPIYYKASGFSCADVQAAVSTAPYPAANRKDIPLMRRAFLALVLAIACAGSAAAHYCAAPLADWQPREALQKKLETDGWSDIAIRIEDGCYLAHASNARGERLHGKFDPVTLAPMPGGGRHHHHHDGDDGPFHPDHE